MFEELAEIALVMRSAHARDISPYDDGFVQKAVARRLAATGVASSAAYADYLAQCGAEAETLARSLNITHSEFFRNALTFAVLEQIVLPSLTLAKEAAGGAEIRIWSAGCAAGQEPYSLAMLTDSLRAHRRPGAPFRIFATDRSELALASARGGVYDEAAVQNVTHKMLCTYFTKLGESYRVVDVIRDRVDYSVHDLLDQRLACPPSSIYGDFDLVFCGNLLFYYRPEIRHVILAKLHRSLSPSGYLVTGEVEREFVMQHEGFRNVVAPSPVFQKANRSS